MNANEEFERLRVLFGMRPPESGEGTLIKQNLKDGFGTAIVALIGGEHFSALHRLESTEVYHFYADAPRRRGGPAAPSTCSAPRPGPTSRARG